MELQTIINKRQLEDLIGQLRNYRLPFKIALQSIYPIRSVESNDYLWGFIYTPIAEETGQTPEEVHEAYKKKFNFRYDLKYNSKENKYVWVSGVGSTALLDTQEIWDYIMKVRADAEIELHLTLQMPNETFINELNFNEK